MRLDGENGVFPPNTGHGNQFAGGHIRGWADEQLTIMSFGALLVR